MRLRKEVKHNSSLVAQWSRTCLPMQEMRIQSLSLEDPLEKEMAIHSSILAWEMPWTEKPGGRQFRGGHRRVRHDLATKQQQQNIFLQKSSSSIHCAKTTVVSPTMFGVARHSRNKGNREGSIWQSHKAGPHSQKLGIHFHNRITRTNILSVHSLKLPKWIRNHLFIEAVHRPTVERQETVGPVKCYDKEGKLVKQRRGI